MTAASPADKPPITMSANLLDYTDAELKDAHGTFAAKARPAGSGGYHGAWEEAMAALIGRELDRRKLVARKPPITRTSDLSTYTKAELKAQRDDIELRWDDRHTNVPDRQVRIDILDRISRELHRRKVTRALNAAAMRAWNNAAASEPSADPTVSAGPAQPAPTFDPDAHATGSPTAGPSHPATLARSFEPAAADSTDPNPADAHPDRRASAAPPDQHRGPAQPRPR